MRTSENYAILSSVIPVYCKRCLTPTMGDRRIGTYSPPAPERVARYLEVAMVSRARIEYCSDLNGSDAEDVSKLATWQRRIQ